MRLVEVAEAKDDVLTGATAQRVSKVHVIDTAVEKRVVGHQRLHERERRFMSETIFCPEQNIINTFVPCSIRHRLDLIENETHCSQGRRELRPEKKTRLPAGCPLQLADWWA